MFFDSFFRVGAGLILAACASLAIAQNPPAPVLNAKAWLLLDMSSGQILASQNPVERIEPASLTKLMTAYLAFSALKAKTITQEQVVPVSEKAWKAIGSRMFIEPRKPVNIRYHAELRGERLPQQYIVVLQSMFGGRDVGFAFANPSRDSN